MSIEEKFYLLVLDEVRVQPGLCSALSFNLEDYAFHFAGCSLDEALSYLEDGQVCAGGDSFQSAAWLGEPPPELTCDLATVRKALSRNLGQDYSRLCRQALLNLLWQNRVHAEDRINLAKYLRDEWAFAHFILGLLRGLSGDLGRAHFELYLAINREGLYCPRTRIQRALDLLR